MKTGFSNWKKGPERFKEHVKTVGGTHNDSRILFFAFINQRQSVTRCISSGTETQKAQYRTRLTFSLELVRFILRLSIPYRGHKESIDSQNRGNFLEFDEFCSVRMSDIEKAVRNAPLNFKQTSHRTQTDLIHSCGAVTRKFIISDIGHKFFSLLIDEARDNSIKEQMAIVVR